MTAAQTQQEVLIREYKPHELIVAEGSPNTRFFVILSGNVEIMQNSKSIRILKDGDVFGLENYYLERSFTTSAISMTKSRIAAYDATMIREFIYDRPQLIQQVLLSVMRQLEQTTEIAEQNIPLENVVDLNERIFHDGEIIIREEDEGMEIYRLVESEGGLLVTKAGSEIGRITKPGEYFGEISSILKEKRSATVRSVGRSVVQVFSGDNLQDVLEAYPQLSTQLIDTLAQRLLVANQKIVAQEPPI